MRAGHAAANTLPANGAEMFMASLASTANALLALAAQLHLS